MVLRLGLSSYLWANYQVMDFLRCSSIARKINESAEERESLGKAIHRIKPEKQCEALW